MSCDWSCYHNTILASDWSPTYSPLIGGDQGGSIQFKVALEAEEMAEGRRAAVPKMYPIFGHKFREVTHHIS